MTNLLPQTQQAVIKKEYSYRRAIVMLFALVATVLVSTGFLIPSFVLSNVKLSNIADEAQRARAVSEVQNTQNTSGATLKDVKGKLVLLKPEATEHSVQSVIDLITKDKSADIRLQNIAYSRGSDGAPGKITLNGLAKNRDSITKFASKMQSNAIFKNVDLPVSNFAKDKDIAFSMQISGTF
jgi:Tfp pilus assembly protein PilN